jgi:hypothetical protein
MRNKEYIVNLVTTLIGHSVLNTLTARADVYSTANDLLHEIEFIIVPKLHEMSAEKLGAIIEYSDHSFLIANSNAIHRGKVFNIHDSPAMNCIKENLSYGGHNLLVHLASMTVMSIAFDLVKQADYEQDRRRLELQDEQQYRQDVSVGLYEDNDGERR